MPNFTARLFSGGTVTVWSDPATATAPSRLNPNPARLHTYLRVAPSTSISVRATVGGVEGPLDGALGGKLFTAWWAHWSGPFPPAIVQPAGQTSVANVTFGATHLGHFILFLGRDGGGAVGIPFDVEA